MSVTPNIAEHDAERAHHLLMLEFGSRTEFDRPHPEADPAADRFGRSGTAHVRSQPGRARAEHFRGVSVLVVDDQERCRTVVAEVVDAVPGFRLIGAAASGEDAIAAVGSSCPGSLCPELVLMDVRMPGMGGIRATQEILGQHQSVVVILMTADDTVLMPDHVHDCGAAALMRKQDLCPRTLWDVWERRGPPEGAEAARADRF